MKHTCEVCNKRVPKQYSLPHYIHHAINHPKFKDANAIGKFSANMKKLATRLGVTFK
jgi:hypothetical protein